MSRRWFFVAALVGSVIACSAFDTDNDTKPSPAPVDGGHVDGGSSGTADGGIPVDSGEQVEVDAAAAIAFASAVGKLPGLVGYWHLDEGGQGPPIDVVAGNQGVYQPNVAAVPALLVGDGGATSFNSGAVSIASPKDAGLSRFDKALTVGVVVKVATLGVSDEFIVFKYGTFGLGVTSDGHVFLDVQTGGSSTRFKGNQVTVNTTALVIASFDLASESVTIWINNQPATPSTPFSLGPTANIQNVCIGGATSAGGTDCRGFTFYGTLDEVFLANQAVNADTVANLTKLAGL